MTPTTSRAVGHGQSIRFAVGLLAGVFWLPPNQGVCGLQFGEISALPRPELIGSEAVFEQLLAKIVGFVETPSRVASTFGALHFNSESGKRCARMRKPPGESAIRKQCAMWHKPACRTRLP
jgi:hypothetical protein